MKLQNIVPWGRDLAEYKEMFMLSNKELQGKILGCGDGPASFNAEVNALGGNVISIDPIYAFSKEQIKERIDEVTHEVIEQVKQNKDSFVWKNIKDIDSLYNRRISAMKSFLKDYDQGKKEGRYLNQMLPNLKFKDKEFNIALSSHFLFLYSEHLDYAFHKNAILEMLRVANEVRIFPIVTLENKRSPHLERIIKELNSLGFSAFVEKVDYEFQKGADEMLVIR